MFENDYIMRQISRLVQFVSLLAFGKSSPAYERQNEQNPTKGDLLHTELLALLEADRINEAENILFKQLEAGTQGALEVALDFYNRLSAFSDERLLRAGFSHEEIDQGLKDALRLGGVVIPDDFEQRLTGD